jgi:hypothetical protein
MNEVARDAIRNARAWTDRVRAAADLAARSMIKGTSIASVIFVDELLSVPKTLSMLMR